MNRWCWTIGLGVSVLGASIFLGACQKTAEKPKVDPYASVKGPTDAGDSPDDAVLPPPQPPVPLLSADDEIATMKVAPGFKVQVVASEPMVEHPVAMAFDPDGRLWVAEMRGYMQDVDGAGEDEPTGRVSLLEDTDGDGRMDKATVFKDKLVMPRSVAIVGDGVLVGVPPRLILYRDTNGDFKADEETVIASDYHGGGKNPENYANGLLRDIDNWIYNASYDKRLRLVNGKWISEPVPTMGQFGIAQDDVGRLFHNSNSDHLRGSVIMPHYTERNPNYRVFGANEQIAKLQTVWPAHSTVVNRGYGKNFLRPDGTLTNFTAACSPHIYRGGIFGSEFQGNAFVCEPIANVVRRDVIEEKDGKLLAHNAYEQSEFIASTYERFRPVNLTTGPDGALYIADMHHGLLQHSTHLTRWAKVQYLQRELQKHLLTGRIFRVVPEKGSLTERPNLSTATPAQLIGYLSHPNGWWRDTAQRLLVEKGDYRVAISLRKIVTGGKSSIGRLHALWTLEGMGQLDSSTVAEVLRDSDPKVRAAAIRTCEPMLSIAERRAKVLPALLKLASDTDPSVRLQFALSMTAVGTPEADAALAKILYESADNTYVRDGMISGLRGRELEFLEEVLASPTWKTESAPRASVLSALASCVVAEAKPPRVARLLDTIAAQSPDAKWRQLAMVNGFPEPAKADDKRRPKAIMLPGEPTKLLALKSKLKLDRVLAIAHWPGEPGYVPPKPPKPLTAAQQARFEKGRAIYAATCIQCHKANGLGQDGLAPPLLGSEWALGPESRIVRVVLHGVQGPIAVDGRPFNLEMPGLGKLSDEDIASVITYVRREWDHEASPVDPETVKNVRKETAGRSLPWTERELLRIK